MAAEQVVGWVAELANGFGIPGHQLPALLAGVRAAVDEGSGSGAAFDSVAIVRDWGGFEVRLTGPSATESFLLHF